ncbi:hypothetical protein PF007_g97 [Phytophthora fragariae]|uniref:Uncharacterized protein n=1 Tax=Phytophthora fragariae TaxID=53985 RepID=A0A6A3MF91_9STRA|nr:hypothetical protein PF003_g5710 [Phytophthora fragariae]KAE9031099.1 hypothetical protein PF011_g299 [Phytophthora fragariae]KAE9141614.1 hypothetical protein PF007_g97 [Phytophthora fragariae]KAE9331072.1 hypothetical protein PF001_g28 [Phytophthora fragariae]
MFLELSFDSRAGDKEASASKATRSWRYDNDDQQEMSLDELISDFRQSATGRRSKLDESVSRSEASPLQVASPPKHSKPKRETGKKNRGFADRARVSQRETTKSKTLRAAHKNERDDDSSDDEGAVMPMPRLEQVLRNKPSFLPKRRGPPVAASTRSTKTASRQSRKPPPPSPVLSSPSLSPASLSPVTCSSAASSPLSMPEVTLSPDEDSIDALIGKDIRELNKLIAASSRGSQTRSVHAAKSPSTDEIAQVPTATTSKSRSRIESPPPPPPPDDDEDFDEDEEDSFAEEIRKLRESRRLNSLPVKAPENEEPKDKVEPTSSEICATAALKVRNASNTINGLLLEALKPFEDRRREEEAQALERENAGGDSAILKAAQAELQSATQTIVSQLDLTFADMTERRKADMKAEADAATAAKVAEKKEKEAIEEKKKADEKEAKLREMEILRLIPMQGKLLTCSADIENVLMQLETIDASTPSEPAASAFAMEADIKALRSHTQRRIEEIEARMTGSSSTKPQSGESSGISWRAVDWAADNLELSQVNLPGKGDTQHGETTANSAVDATITEEEGPLQEILQRDVLEKLDLTMLKLKHVLCIDTKESAEMQEKQKHEEEEQAKQLAQKQLEDDRKQQELEDAENARRRVMGLTSLDEVEGWMEEGRRLHDDFSHSRSLNRLVDSLENRMNAQEAGDSSSYLRTMHPNQEEALRQFDYLTSAMAAPSLAERFGEEGILDRGDHKYDKADVNQRGQSFHQRTQGSRPRQPSGQQMKILSGFSDSEGESSSANIGFDSDEDRHSVMVSKHRELNRDARQKNGSPLHPASSCTQKAQSIRGKGNREYLLKPAASKCSEYEVQGGKWHSSPREKKHSRRHGDGRHQFDVARTIQALQADRRQKTAWIQSHRKTPPSRSPRYNSALL